MVQYSNKKVSLISRDSILPIGGLVAPVLPGSVQLSTIESDVQGRNFDTYLEKNPEQNPEISSFGDVISIAAEKLHSDNLVNTIDNETKEVRKLCYLESLNNNVIDALPNIITQTAKLSDQIKGNKDIIVIAPIKVINSS